MELFYAGGFLYNPETKSVLLHKRDGKTTVNPHKWGFFGGLSEGDETPIQAFTREMKEELDIDLAPSDIIPLLDYRNEERQTHRYVFYIESNREKSSLHLGEGADFDWIPLTRVFTYDITDKTADDLHFFRRRRPIKAINGGVY